MEKLKCKMEVQYNGHSIKKSGDLDLNVIAPYSDIVNSLLLTRMLNCNIELAAKINNKKPFKLGTFMLKNLNIDRDGESKIKFNSEIDSAEIDNFTLLSEREVIVTLLCVAEVESEDEDDEGDEDNEE